MKNTKQIDDGGPAFPRAASDPAWGNGTESFEGMSLRVWLAAQAMQGMLSMNDDVAFKSPAKCAAWAFEFADEIIAAGKAEPTK